MKNDEQFNIALQPNIGTIKTSFFWFLGHVSARFVYMYGRVGESTAETHSIMEAIIRIMFIFCLDFESA
eukprot:m.224167 g.224167  ORF g.224167 m.224167 type:complete len:69 (-) comp15644_c1_seq2:3270-3476(-)